MPTDPPRLSIQIQPREGGRYKSIGHLTWSDIPGFALLTGRNGVGKSQLLEVLAYHYSGACPSGLDRLPVEVTTQGEAYGAHELGYLPSVGRFSGGAHTSIAQVQNIRQQIVNHVSNAHSYRHDITSLIKARRGEQRLLGHNVRYLTPEQLNEILPDSLEFAIDDIDVTEGLTHVFIGHRFKALEAIEAGRPGKDLDGKDLPKPPWEVVNEALKVAGFPYEVISPLNTRLTDNYTLRLRDLGTGLVIDAIDLSSGEKVILQVVLWLFTAGKEGLMPRLLLLDEPDAHLHPSMTTQFLDVLVEVLVRRHGVRVIMTTHSPSTVALAPDGAVFKLERGASTVEPAGRTEMISILTAGLVTVARTSKFCFVEDEDDVNFYEAVRDILTDQGPSKDAKALDPNIPIAFVSVSVGSGQAKRSGGKTVVTKWINKLAGEPLDKNFLGIIDRDAGNPPTDRIFVLGRYSFENYLLDPLTLFALLVENGTAPPIPDQKVSQGDEHILRTLPKLAIQSISDIVCAAMEAAEPALAAQRRRSVEYTNGVEIDVPGWVYDHRGHDLLPIAQHAFGGPQLINPVRLLKAFRRGRLVPVELASLLSKVQMT